MASINWNEANTFSKLTEPMLRSLGYPLRSSEFCDEESYVEKKSGGNGRYDVAYKSDRGILLLVEMKKKDKTLGTAVESQAFNYALGATFDPLPPPFLMISNGEEHQWFRRIGNKDKTFKFVRCNPIKWREAMEERASGDLTQELTLNQVIRLLQKTRTMIFNDLRSQFFSSGYSFNKSKLKNRRIAFEQILNTRKSFVDPTLQEKKEEKAIEAIVSSIALSLTLKVLFLKILSDLSSRPLTFAIKKEIARLSDKYPGILKAEPYDVLEFSFECERKIYEMLNEVSITESLVFEAKRNPIGDIFDGLVKSEELDIQVKSLGNVYTPPEIVNAMVTKAEKALGSFKDSKVLEPSCGSGHFVREVYSRMFKAYKPQRGNSRSIVEAHKKSLKNILAVDIDPFAIQTTQLGMFLELNIFPGVWKSLSSSKGLAFGNVAKCGDYLHGKRSLESSRFKPDLVIGNPPYGVAVTEDIQSKYKLDNNDSYGVFIAKAIDDLTEDGHLMFVISSTFLLNKSHAALRKKIYQTASPSSIYMLHRKAFNRDVFCCLLHLQKRPIRNISKSFYSYNFYDAWSIHPTNEKYKQGLQSWAKNEKIVGKDKLDIGFYKVPVRYAFGRVVPPNSSELDKFLSSNASTDKGSLPRKMLFEEFKVKKNQEVWLERKPDEIMPIWGGQPKIFLYCLDTPNTELGLTESSAEFPQLGRVSSIKIKASKKDVNLVKLWQISRALQGLATADDQYFLRKTPGVVPNARRRDIEDVELKLTVTGSRLSNLTEAEKRNGIKVIDPQATPHFVPFDTGGEADTGGGELRVIHSKVDYWIDWSEAAVDLLKKRNKFPSGKAKKPRLNNFEKYFSKAIAGTITGLYAPTFFQSFGGVFGQKANLIIPYEESISDYLLLILSSKFTRYVAKNFISNSVDFSTDNFKHLPIPVPTEKEIVEASKIIKKVSSMRRGKKGIPYETISKIVDPYVYRLFGLSMDDQQEIDQWFKRHYHLLGKKDRVSRSTNQSSPRVRRTGG